MTLHRIYVWTDVALVTEGEYQCANYSALLLPIRGKANWSLNGQNFEQMKADAYILPPHTAMSFDNASGSPWSAFLISFKSIEVADMELDQSKDVLASDHELELYIATYSYILHLAEQLFTNQAADNEAESYKLHSLFQRIMQLVLETILVEGEQGTDEQAIPSVKKSITRIDQSFSEQIQYTDLAQQCGLSPRHYSRIFRKLTGLSPIQYIIQNRIKEAKKLLVDETESVQQVAVKSGFNDPFHFSRTFKKHVGISPRLYVNLHREHSRIAVYQFLGEMLALGVKPIGAPKPLLSGKYVRHLVDGVKDTGTTVVQPNISLLKGLEPDAIFTFDGYHLDQYSLIAPTLNITWMQPAFKRFRSIAGLMGREHQAEAWVSDYEEQVYQAKKMLVEKIDREKTVSFWYFREFVNKFDVYYERELLYDDLQMTPPEAVKQAREERASLPFKQSMDVTEMPRYAGDYMLVVVDRHGQQWFDELTKGSLWSSLPAVKQGRVRILTTDWLFVDPISRLGQLKELPELFGG